VLRAVTQRLARLPAPSANLAVVAAVLGDGTLDEAAALAGLPLAEAAQAADDLAADALVRPGEELRFVHPLVRSAIYAEIAPAERAVKHLEAARLLDSRGSDVERVAAHLLRAPRGADRWVVETLRRAARAARAAGVPESTVSYLRRAVDEPPDGGHRPETVFELGQAEAAMGDPEAEVHFEEAAVLSPTPRERAAVLGELGRTLYTRGQLRDAADAFDRGIGVLEGHDEDLRMQLEAGWITVARLDQELRPEAVERLKPILDRQSAGATHAERVLLANVANEVVFAAEPRDLAIELARRALADGALLREESSDGMTWIIAAGSLGWADELDEFAAIATEAAEDGQRRGSVTGFAQAVYGRAFSLYYKGDLTGAEADLELAIGARRYGWDQFLTAAIAQYAWALVDRGALDAAESVLGPALEDPRRRDSAMGALLREAQARVDLERGRPRDALERSLQAGEFMNASLMPNPAILPWRGRAALASAQLGESEQALRLVDEEVEIARRFGAPRVLGMALRVSGVVRAGSDGIAILHEALSVLESSPAKLEFARALIDLGGALRRNRDVVAAREPLRLGLDMALGFGARALQRRAEDELAASGARVRRKSMTGRDALTPSEYRIADMAAGGMSNRQIAQGLFLTARTVETHLTHAYRKLDISSRTQLPTALTGPEAGR
jgi:DNA-binding CsgD family transcriptional regulator/tetratricopeptide (TPR) repeat protein